MDELLVQRFHERYEIIPEGWGCWIWTASKGGHGYGDLRTKHAHYTSHRLSWLIHYGDIPEGMFVCHKCDTRLCVRPDHLFLGTHQDNMADMRRKKRHGGPSRKNEEKQLAICGHLFTDSEGSKGARQCRPCIKAYQEAYRTNTKQKEKKRLYDMEYRVKHKERLKRQKAEQYARNTSKKQSN